MVRTDIASPGPLAMRILETCHYPDSGCWEWAGAKDAHGYGVTSACIRQWTQTCTVHRLMWALIPGNIAPEIGDGKAIDHLCRNRACCNPAHLEVVSWNENTFRGEGVTAHKARQQQCAKGHPLSGANLRIRIRNGRTTRGCKQCRT